MLLIQCFFISLYRTAEYSRRIGGFKTSKLIKILLKSVLSLQTQSYSNDKYYFYNELDYYRQVFDVVRVGVIPSNVDSLLWAGLVVSLVLCLYHNLQTSSNCA